jgi:hypothetical protein
LGAFFSSFLVFFFMNALLFADDRAGWQRRPRAVDARYKPGADESQGKLQMERKKSSDVKSRLPGEKKAPSNRLLK